MRDFKRGMVVILVLWSLVLLAGCNGTGTTEAADNQQPEGLWEKLTSPSQKFVVPAGTRLEARLDESLSSKGNSSGDTFDATLERPITIGKDVVVPKGAKLSGRVTEARESGHLKTPAALAITLTGMEVNGDSYDITTTSFARRAASHKGHDAKWIGGSAAGGALLGALIGGGKGAAIGAGVGAGGGTAGAYATGKKDIVLPAETLISFDLRDPVTVTK